MTTNRHILYSPASSIYSMQLFLLTHSWGREGLRKGSESLPFTTLVLRCFGSDVEASDSEGDAGFGGFLLARSFLCRSISSLCWLMLSCCLKGRKHSICEAKNSNCFLLQVLKLFRNHPGYLEVKIRLKQNKGNNWIV